MIKDYISRDFVLICDRSHYSSGLVIYFNTKRFIQSTYFNSPTLKNKNSELCFISHLRFITVLLNTVYQVVLFVKSAETENIESTFVFYCPEAFAIFITSENPCVTHEMST